MVQTRWTGGMRAVSQMSGFEIVVDEPQMHGGANTGPQPTDLLLTSIASCVALSVAFVARKRGIDLLGLDVQAVGSYSGMKFDRIAVTVSSGLPHAVLQDLVDESEQFCYVSNTLRNPPKLTVDVDVPIVP